MRYIALIAAVAGSLALAGCGPDSATDDNIGTTDMPAESSTTTPIPPDDAGMSTDPAGAGTGTGLDATGTDATGTDAAAPGAAGTGTGTTAP